MTAHAVTVKVLNDVHGSLLEEAWLLYEAAFRRLAAHAVQRHLMRRSEFDEVMADPRIDKYLALDDDGALDGLATYTNDLDAVPLVSPQFFERRWPTHYAQRRIWYIGFVAVHPRHAGVGPAFADMVEQMRQVAASNSGIVMIDVCDENADLDNQHHLPRAVHLMVGRSSPGVLLRREDAQSYWTYEFPPINRCSS